MPFTVQTGPLPFAVPDQHDHTLKILIISQLFSFNLSFFLPSKSSFQLICNLWRLCKRLGNMVTQCLAFFQPQLLLLKVARANFVALLFQFQFLSLRLFLHDHTRCTLPSQMVVLPVTLIFERAWDATSRRSAASPSPRAFSTILVAVAKGWMVHG